MHEPNKKIKTLEQALQGPCKFRDAELSQQPMPNYSKTPGGPHDMPLRFWASWELADRPRRIALLLDDCQEEYRPYAGGVLPNLTRLVDAFRSLQSDNDGVGIMWSAWTRTFDDGISNAMDRWYGPRGLRADDPENAVYIFKGAPGMKPLREIAPTEEEVAAGRFYHGKHLDMFWTFDENGKSYLDEKLKADGIDTIVIVGLWSDECILSTIYAGNSRGYDVVVVNDAVATATANHDIAMKIAGGTVAKVLNTDEVISYLINDFVSAEKGAVKGTSYPDGRRED